MTYFDHFGLNGSPFQFGVSPSALFRGKEHSEALAALEWALQHEPSGYALLIGEAGTGKTTLACSLLMQPLEQVTTAYLNHPRLAIEDLFRLALRQINVVEPPPVSKLDCLEAFRSYLGRTEPGHRIAIVIDEAQGLTGETLEELRLMSEYLRLDGNQILDRNQIHIVLIGQPGLMKMLESPALRHFNERIGVRTLLNPMEPAEVYDYIEHRLSARNGSAKRLFARSALREVVERSGGIARRVNVICHNAMLTAYSSGAQKVSLNHVRDVISEYENLRARVRSYPEPKRRPSSESRGVLGRIARPALAFGLIALTGMGLGSIWRRSGPPHETSAVQNQSGALAGPSNRQPATLVAATNTRPSSPPTNEPSRRAVRRSHR